MRSLNQIKEELASAKTDIANAIIDKGGTVSGGFSSFSTDIFTIPSGGVSPTNSTPVPDGVNFYDYDGTFVAGYTLAEAQALTALPAPPDHSSDEVPLTFQGWNYSLEQVSTETRPIDVGAVYITTDGKTHLKVRVTKVSGGNISFYFRKRMATDTLTIDFGDGQVLGDSQAVTDGSKTLLTFTPPIPLAIGDHDVTVWRSSGSDQYYLGHSLSSTYNSVVGGTTQDHRDALISVNGGDNLYTSIGQRAFYCARSLSTISIPNGLLYVDLYFFNECFSLKAFVLPQTANAIAIQGYAFSKCRSLKMVSLPKNIPGISDSAFSDCLSLPNIRGLYSLTSLGSSIFSNCLSFTKFVVPNSVTSISANTFYVNTGVHQASSIMEYDFTSFTSVPTLAGTGAFNGISSACVIKVPAVLYNSWKAATNWVTYANYLVPV